ncbi:hypothetical protein [Defluviimonas salinarum]|uniref:Uncharacterized protein n=1 Tax=Defluviimonas salinarum TaxID=2992147 RepID=A0ABT3J5J5_9RHOB|nr:hypothetical protein [Defluviimonas salinarum]MCW3782960.1 hypothetical protein [Defluviimonas salinarum]
MSLDFRKLVSPRSRKDYSAALSRAEEMVAMSDRDLAARIVGIARDMRASGAYSTDPRYSYDEWALFRVIPELARRLDPETRLEPEEIAQPDERSDRITFAPDADTARLGEMVKSILANGWFARSRMAGLADGARAATDLLTRFRDALNPMAIAFNRLDPGSYEYRPTPDPPALAGVYVIFEGEHHDEVACYRDDREEALRLAEICRCRIAGEEVGDEDLGRLPHQFGFRSIDEIREKTLAISVQDFEGEILHRWVPETMADAVPSL